MFLIFHESNSIPKYIVTLEFIPDISNPKDRNYISVWKWLRLSVADGEYIDAQ